VYRCVDSIQQGMIQQAQLPVIEHLIVDEFQDLNLCDQEFIFQLTQGGAVLFVAGDDDQSIYMSLRHADPSGIVNFPARYPNSQTHILEDVFRCTPRVLNPANTMIAFNPNRVDKHPVSLYQNSTPPVLGRTEVWSFQNEQEEVDAIAESCQQLISAGMAGQEDKIVILISDRGLQLNGIVRALGNLGLPYDPPRGEALTNVNGIRAIYSLLRILKGITGSKPDYIAHRALMGLLSQVGVGTAKAVGDACIANHQNFRELFYLQALPHWLNARQTNAVKRVADIIEGLQGWAMAETLATRSQDITHVLGAVFSAADTAEVTNGWNALLATLPDAMTLEEFLGFLSTDNEGDRKLILDAVNQRIGAIVQDPQAPAPLKKIKLLTMHGAKGLSGKVVFIPSVEQGIFPSTRAVHATGLLLEARRLFYVSLTRAMAACIISHSASHTGPAAFRLQQRPVVHLPRSQFLNEMGVASVNRTNGLTAAEAAAIVADVANL
jgi:DNA helicase-2/ATP-dependent DNA helicase PcrA